MALKRFSPAIAAGLALFAGTAAGPASAQTQYSSITPIQQSVVGYLSGDGAANLYNHVSFNGKIYMGGWHLTSDIGPDRIFASSSLDPIEPVPITINGQSAPGSITIFGGFHINDPTVVEAPDNSGNLIMFFTCLANGNATAAKESLDANVCAMSSSDQGASWTVLGIVIYQNNGASNASLQQLGAWSPSAVVHMNDQTNGSKNTIWVYYHTNANSSNTQPPVVLRSVFTGPFNSSMNSVPAASLETIPVNFTPNPPVNGNPAPTDLIGINPRVVTDFFGDYLMTTLNGSDQIAAYVSADGINWVSFLKGSSDGTIVTIKPPYNQLVTLPELSEGQNGNYDLYFTTPLGVGTAAKTTDGTEQCQQGLINTNTSPNTCTFFDHWVMKAN